MSGIDQVNQKSDMSFEYVSIDIRYWDITLTF